MPRKLFQGIYLRMEPEAGFEPGTSALRTPHFLEPEEGIEPSAFSLRKSCSTAELLRRIGKGAGLPIPKGSFRD